MSLSVLLLIAANIAMEDQQDTPAMKLFDHGGDFAIDNPTLKSRIYHATDIWMTDPACCLLSHIVISSDLINMPLSWMCCKSSKYYFHPAPPRSRKRAFIVILLLMAGVEQNPGPTHTKIKNPVTEFRPHQRPIHCSQGCTHP